MKFLNKRNIRKTSLIEILLLFSVVPNLIITFYIFMVFFTHKIESSLPYYLSALFIMSLISISASIKNPINGLFFCNIPISLLLISLLSVNLDFEYFVFALLPYIISLCFQFLSVWVIRKKYGH